MLQGAAAHAPSGGSPRKPTTSIRSTLKPPITSASDQKTRRVSS
jgi:hypothetical protein